MAFAFGVMNQDPEPNYFEKLVYEAKMTSLCSTGGFGWNIPRYHVDGTVVDTSTKRLIHPTLIDSVQSIDSPKYRTISTRGMETKSKNHWFTLRRLVSL